MHKSIKTFYANCVFIIYFVAAAAFPSFLKAPSDAKVVQGQTVKFECRANGSPKPKISWQSGSPATSVSGSRFNVLANGDLEIKVC